MRDRKMRDWNYRHQTAGVENAGLEISAPYCRGGKCGTGKFGNKKRMERHVWHNLVFCTWMHSYKQKHMLHLWQRTKSAHERITALNIGVCSIPPCFFHYCHMMFHLNYKHGWPVLIGLCLTGSPPLLLHDGYIGLLNVMFVENKFLSLHWVGFKDGAVQRCMS